MRPCRIGRVRYPRRKEGFNIIGDEDPSAEEGRASVILVKIHR